MRILLLLHQTIDSGADMPRALALGREMHRLGHQVTLFCEPPVRQFPMPRTAFEVVQPPQFAPAGLQGRGLHPASLVWRSRWLRGRGYDVVQSFGVRPPAVLPAWWLQARGTCWVADWSDYWGWHGIGGQRGILGKLTVASLDTLLERSSRLYADGVTVVSTFLERRCYDWGIGEDSVLRLGGGADVRSIRPIEHAHARQSLGVDHGSPILVFSGGSRFDVEIIRRVFQAVCHRNREVRLFLLGAPSVASKDLGRQRGVVDWGFQPLSRMAEVIACGDVMLLPLLDARFNRARFPNRLGDYMAAGRPIVTNPTGDVGRTVRESGAGLVVGESAEEMAEATLALCNDPVVRGEMGLRGRRYAEQALAWSRLADSLLGFYARVMNAEE